MTAMRELAERWKDDGDLLVRECGDALSAILDAEGDGGAVPAELFAWLTARDLVPDLDEDGSFDMHLLIEALNEHERQLQATHPARSGVVRDEDVDGFIEALKNKGLELIFKEDRPYIRAALEHFSKFRDATEPAAEVFPGTHASLSALSIQPKATQP